MDDDEDQIPDPIAAWDQAIRQMGDFARAVWTHYESMVGAGFNPDQALTLTVEFERHLLAANT